MNKLEQLTGYNYAWFYLSTQAENCLIDFNNPEHKKLIDFLCLQEESIAEKGELTPAEIRKGRRMFHQILGEKISYSKYDGADCFIRLSESKTIFEAKQEWSDLNLIQKLFRK